MSDECKNPPSNLTPQWFLNQILCLLRGLVSPGGANVALPSGTQEISVTTHEANYIVPAGATFVEVHLSADFEGGINEVPYTGAAWQVIGPFVATPGKTLGSFGVDWTAGSFNVITIV